jgi:hypothetical protein
MAENPKHSHTNITGYRQHHHIVTGWTQEVSSSTQQQTNTTGSVQQCEIKSIKYNLQTQGNGNADCDDKLECISEHEVRSSKAHKCKHGGWGGTSHVTDTAFHL